MAKLLQPCPENIESLPACANNHQQQNFWNIWKREEKSVKHREFKYASSPLFSSCGQPNLDFLPILPFPSSTSLYSIISVKCTRTCSLFRLLFPGCPLYFEKVVLILFPYSNYIFLVCTWQYPTRPSNQENEPNLSPSTLSSPKAADKINEHPATMMRAVNQLEWLHWL